MRAFNHDLGQFEKFDVVVVEDTSLAVVTENEVIKLSYYTDGKREIAIQYVDGPLKGQRVFIDPLKVQLSTMTFMNIIGTDYLLDRITIDKTGTVQTVQTDCNPNYEPYFLKFDPVKGQIPGSGN